jgi:DNA-directed RNA polymerase specialized sigma24 family protein
MRILGGCGMPSEKPFWIAPGNGKQQFPDRLVQAGYQLKNRIARFTAYLLRDPSRAPELTENAIQDLVERKGAEAIQHHANVRGLLYGRVRALTIQEKRRADRLVYYSASEMDDRFGASHDDDLDEKIDTDRLLSRLEGQLKPNQKEVLKLVLLDYDISEIASALGITENAAYKRYRKLMEKARGLLPRQGR